MSPVSGSDPCDLNRFVEAQSSVIVSVEKELNQGIKTGHWMWFVFPQVAGLGGSYMSERYAIKTHGEAKAYLEHPVLGRHLEEHTRLVLSHQDRNAVQIFAQTDALKFKSSMTLFDHFSDDSSAYNLALQKFYAGTRCKFTQNWLLR